MDEVILKTITNLKQMDVLREPVIRAALDGLAIQSGSRGLDIGCGIGQQALLLAEQVGSHGQVTGLDLSEDLLQVARLKASQSPFAARVGFRQGDMYSLPFEDNAFDWAWSADCAGYPAGDHLAVLREIVRVVRPGGWVALLGWSGQKLLPGYSLLEARLNAACSAYQPFLQGQPPERYFERILGFFPLVGLVDSRASTLVGQVQPPVSAGERAALAALFAMLWGQPQTGAAPADILQYQRLCRPESPDCILDLPGYNGFFTCTLYTARVAEKGNPHIAQ